jgi:uncharacterized protein YecT (DUF1311 family)
MAAAAVVAAPVCLASDKSSLSPEYAQCMQRVATNPDFAACGDREVKKQEDHLNAAWKKALACFDESDNTARDAKNSLVREQRLWITWKDAACNFYFPSKPTDANFGFAGREGQAIAAPSCKAGIISERAAFLDGFAKDCGTP